MKTSDFAYDLPKDLVAFYPASPRDHSHILIDDKSRRIIPFYTIPELFGARDCLVFNDTKVIKARLNIRNQRTHRLHEALFQHPGGDHTASFMLSHAKKCREGDTFAFGDAFVATLAKKDGYTCHFAIPPGADLMKFMDQYGQMPLPPYVERETINRDQIDYQTVFARSPGASAAPTAGLHFTQEILHTLRLKGVTIIHVTLHVGLGTFLPVKVSDPEQHRMHAEFIELTEEAAHLLNAHRRAGGTITAIGTTSLRVLETCYSPRDGFFAYNGNTSIFLRPPAPVLSCHNLLTNFHQSESTLMMLVSAFGGLDKIKQLYRYAIEHKMRFLSFGDCMLLKNIHTH